MMLYINCFACLKNVTIYLYILLLSDATQTGQDLIPKQNKSSEKSDQIYKIAKKSYEVVHAQKCF